MSDMAFSQGVVRQRVHDSIAVKSSLLQAELVDSLCELAQRVADCVRSGGKIILFGNGGSAADATHLAAEFVGRFMLERDPMPALSLSDNASAVTAIGNDYAYDLTFSRQIRALGAPGDVALGLSCSGSSMNVLNALHAARDRGMFTAGFTGTGGAAMALACDLCITVPSAVTARIQEGYMLYAHIMCELVEEELFGAATVRGAARAALPDAVLLDRDGTINVQAAEGDYITRPDQVELMPGAGDAIRALNDAHVPVVVVTNQRGIALGRMTETDLDAVHVRLRELLFAYGAHLDGIFHCPHEKDQCACRKPGTLLLARARDHLGLAALRGSVVIGDSPSDVAAGRAMGASTILLAGTPTASADLADGEDVAASLALAVARTLGPASRPATPRHGRFVRFGAPVAGESDAVPDGLGA